MSPDEFTQEAQGVFDGGEVISMRQRPDNNYFKQLGLELLIECSQCNAYEQLKRKASDFLARHIQDENRDKRVERKLRAIAWAIDSTPDRKSTKTHKELVNKSKRLLGPKFEQLFNEIGNAVNRERMARYEQDLNTKA